MVESELRELQLAELNILKKVIEICKHYNLHYYALGGTLLGAIRHKGFIPWDDDIDIGLPRDDYEKLLIYLKQELQAPYQLHTVESGTGQYAYYFARVENSLIKVEKFFTINKTVVPAWIDIFPLDNVPDDDVEMKKWIAECQKLKQVFTLSQASYVAASDSLQKKRSAPKAIARRIFLKLKLDRFINTKKAWLKLDTALKKYQNEKCNRLINFCGFWGIKELFPKSIYEETREYDFEDIKLVGPENFDYVLKQMYGDYMTPPPENKRDHHHIRILHS